MFERVENWYEPIEELYLNPEFECEMTREEHGFLCGLIKKVNPRKLVEIGVAEGGTTAVIAEALSLCDGNHTMYSVDLNQKLFYDISRDTGHLFQVLWNHERKGKSNVEHSFLFGKSIAGQLELIGGDIDFAVIDTTHSIPGEVLDYICLLPYMSKNGIIVLHDVNCDYCRAIQIEAHGAFLADRFISTKHLLAASTGKKYMNLDTRMQEFSNIGAIQVNERSYENVSDVLYLLSSSWNYIPNDEMLQEYKSVIDKKYDIQIRDMFDMVIRQSKYITDSKTLATLKACTNEVDFSMCKKIPFGSEIIIYGTGNLEKSLYIYSVLTDCYKVIAWIAEDYQNYAMELIRSPKILGERKFDYIVGESERIKEWGDKCILLDGKCSTDKILDKDAISKFTIGHHRFSFADLAQQSKVCIYGAGKVGHELYNLFEIVQYYDVVGWVDADTNKHNEVIKPVETIEEMELDAIIIAVESEELYAQIKETITSKYNIKVIGPIKKR